MENVIPLLTALLLGACIGLERKLNDHRVGIHTHALVSIGAALFILLGLTIAPGAETGRVLSQIVTGVGFLCCAVIMRDGLRVRGINTAVTLWCSAAIGAIAGAAAYGLAIAATVIVVVANFLLHYIEHRAGWFAKADTNGPDTTGQPQD